MIKKYLSESINLHNTVNVNRIKLVIVAFESQVETHLVVYSTVLVVFN